MITKRLHALHAKAQKSQSSSLDNSESEGEKETVGVVPTTMTTKALYADILKPKSSMLDITESEGTQDSQDSEEVVQTSQSPVQASGRRQQKRSRKASKSPPTTYDSSSSDSSEEDAPLIPENRLFVGGVPLKLREKDLSQIFAEFGEVQHAVVHRARDKTSKVLIEFLASFPSFPCTIRCH
jgi:hypothetical protein